MRKLLTLTALGLIAGIALFAFGAKQTFADQRDFRLHNRSYVAITHVYVSPANSDYWGSDVLEGDVVYPGDYTDILFSRFDFRGDCIFDVRVDSEDGARSFDWGVNLCETSDINFR